MPVNDYITKADIKAAMPDGNWGTTYDSELDRLSTAASRAVDRACNREDGFFKVTDDSTRFFTGDGCSELWVDPFYAITELATDDAWSGTYTPWSVNDYFTYPYNAAQRQEPYRKLEINQLGSNRLYYWPRFPRSVRMIAKFGFAATPPALIVQASIIQATRWWKRQTQAFSDVSAVLELGQVVFTKKLDPDLEQIVNTYPYAEALSYL